MAKTGKSKPKKREIVYHKRDDWCACDASTYCAFACSNNKTLRGNCFHAGNDLNARHMRCRLRNKGKDKTVLLNDTGVERIKVRAYNRNEKAIGAFLVSKAYPPDVVEYGGYIYKYHAPFGPILNGCYVYEGRSFKTDTLESV